MKIKHLPFAFAVLAMKNIDDQGIGINADTENLKIDSPVKDGNFDWAKSNEGESFWKLVSIGYYDEAESMIDMAEIKEKILSGFNSSAKMYAESIDTAKVKRIDTTPEKEIKASVKKVSKTAAKKV